MENTHPTFNLNGVSTFPSHVEKGKGAHDSAMKTAEYALQDFKKWWQRSAKELIEALEIIFFKYNWIAD